jgi:hypothetical protein
MGGSLAEGGLREEGIRDIGERNLATVAAMESGGVE